MNSIMFDVAIRSGEGKIVKKLLLALAAWGCLAVTTIASHSQAAPFCFSSVAQASANMSRLPALFRSSDIYVVHDDFVMRGAFHVFEHAGLYYFEGAGQLTGLHVVSAQARIAKFCVTNNQIYAELSSSDPKIDRSNDTIQLVGGAFLVRGFRFERTDGSGYQAVLRSLRN